MGRITCQDAHLVQTRILERYLDLKTKILEFERTGRMDIKDIKKDKEWIELSISFLKLRLKQASYELKGWKSTYVDYNYPHNSMLEEYFNVHTKRSFHPADTSLRLQNGDKKFCFVVLGDDGSTETKEAIITEIEKRGLRPAIFQEHVAYFMAFPEDTPSDFSIFSAGDFNFKIFSSKVENSSLPSLNSSDSDSYS